MRPRPKRKLRCLEAMFRELPKHKGTDKLQAELKQKISRVKKEAEQQKKAGEPARAEYAFLGKALAERSSSRHRIRGRASCWRASLEPRLKFAPYPFTTREPGPGMMPWEDVMVQLIDTPPVTKDIMDASLQGLIRGAELALLVEQAHLKKSVTVKKPAEFEAH